MRIPEDELSRGCYELKEHGNKEFPFNIYLCSIPQDFTGVRVHWHQEMELIVVKKGGVLVTVDKEIYLVKEGEAAVVLPGQLHGIAQDGGAKGEYENIIFRLGMLISREEDVCGARYLIPLEKGEGKTAVHMSGESPGYEVFMEGIGRLDCLCKEKAFGYELGVKSALFQIAAALFQSWKPQTGKSGKGARERMKGLLDYIEEHYGERITIRDAAERCYYSQSHFMKYFRQYMGISFVEYLNRYRISRAAGLLRATERPISLIARDCGFDNLSYFNRLFRRDYGMTPGEYRKEGKKDEGISL